MDDITIKLEEYNRLVASDQMLILLEEYGVDNWPGYEDARLIFIEETGEEYM